MRELIAPLQNLAHRDRIVHGAIEVGDDLGDAGS